MIEFFFAFLLLHTPCPSFVHISPDSHPIPLQGLVGGISHYMKLGGDDAAEQSADFPSEVLLPSGVGNGETLTKTQMLKKKLMSLREVIGYTCHPPFMTVILSS